MMKIFDVYLDDSKNVYKITVPAKDKKQSEQYVQGNEEIITKDLIQIYKTLPLIF